MEQWVFLMALYLPYISTSRPVLSLPPHQGSIRHIITMSSLLGRWFGCLFGCFPDNGDCGASPVFLTM